MPSVQRCRSRIVVVAVSLTVWSAAATDASAQDLPLATSYPGSEAFTCPVWTQPGPASPEAVNEARTLASEANEALVLGDLERAESFLSRALELDGLSADLLYRYARSLEARGARADAIAYLCRVVALGAGTEEVGDAQARLDSLAALDRPSLSPDAIAAFERGVSMARMGRTAAAGAAFDSALRTEPDWAPAVYNSGVISAQRGDRTRAVEQLRRYLTLAPDAPDAVIVSRAIGRWEGEGSTGQLPRRATNPGAALALGLFLPGSGQFYSGRPWPGVGVLAVASGAVATGLLVTEVKVRCVGTTQPSGSCPPGQVVGRQTRRPYLVTGLLVAAGVSAAGALEAFFRARGARGSSPAFFTSVTGSEVVILSIGVP
jgi:tetratricopeptide (TPR) repeat protein